ncbi:MAG TPA: amino acid adenylation domain-containing protein, partial [Candidatus Dormibacteraeota bacterium]|nr:amino acid adenylation domain-containing protein [Candidatus Dormibacteraeota bacterium]
MSEGTTTSNEVAVATLLDVLRLRGETQAEEIAYRFLADGEEERSSLTYGELYRRARQIAAELQAVAAVGQRALLLDASELDFIVAFFGCLCAGVIAVPTYAPRVNKKGNARVESVVADAQPSVVLTAGAGSSAVRDVVMASAGEQVRWIDTNAIPADRDKLWTPPVLSGTDIAFLQYTSGSTATPKGVMVSHANILHNERMIQKAFDTRPGSVIVGWLPLYHDMGLIGNVLQPLFAGVPSILMSPVAFLQRPLRWLQAISRYQATTSGGPNFAYELCMRKTRPEDQTGLDLSSWRVAFNGAEPVRLETLNRFAAQFADCGFRREAFVPCYGLAEATLFVSGGLDPNGVTTANHGANGNAKNGGSVNGGSGNGAKVSRKQEKLLVACGRPSVEQAVRIVSPDSLRPCSSEEVGEIWVQGLSVAQGYWRKAAETEETFHARIPETNEGPFLRTGDLGFLKDGHLFITGRLKDLLIIRGQNYYPQDIELTVEQSHAMLQPGSGAAFSGEIAGEERLVVVQEVAVRKDPESIVQKDLDELDALIKLIARNIVTGHELQAFAVVLIRKGTIPKTSSGKIQRHACRDAFLNRELHVLREWHEREAPEVTSRDSTGVTGQQPMRDGLAAWLVAEIADSKKIDRKSVDLQQPFTAYSFDSLDAVEFAHKLQTEFGVEVAVSEFFSDSTITEIIQRATDTMGTRASKRVNEQPARYPLSYGQRALWFVHQTAPESAAYNIARAIRIANGLDVAALRLALQALVDRHPCLRTIVVETAGEPVQQVAEKVEVSFEYFDARDWSQAELEKALVQQSQRPFSLTLGPLFRTALYARSEKEYVLHVAVHHMVADYWTLTLLLDEIGKLYQAYANKIEIHLVPLEYSYADFVEWQREKLSGPAGERLRDYWKNELAGELPPLSLPADHGRPPVQTFRGASFPFSLDARLTEALKRLGEEQQATLFTTLLAAFQVLLHRLTSQEQVIVGCPIAGRSRAEFANIAGYFVNAVPLRADFQQRQTFTEFLSQVRNRVSKAFAHELYPFSLMVEQLGIARDPAVPPIFQSAFVFQQTYGNRSEDFVRFALGQPQAQVTLGGLQLEHVVVDQQTAQFDLTLTVGEGPDGIVGAWEYSSDLFEKATIARWAESFSVLLEGIVSNPEISVSQLPILSDSEYGTLVYEWNRTEAQYPLDKCVQELFEEQVRRSPQATAVAFEEEELSYGELNARANQLGWYLRERGVGPDVLVGIFLERSVEMLVGLLGILKAGGGYLPLDPNFPAERLRYMLEDARPALLLTQDQLRQRIVDAGALQTLCLDRDWETIGKQPETNLRPIGSGENLTYVIYTSGSTGRPKGVMVTRQALMNFLQSMTSIPGIEQSDVLAAVTTVSFDIAGLELYLPLITGARILLLSRETARDAHELHRKLIQHSVTMMQATPSTWSMLLLDGWRPSSAFKILCGGEALNRDLATKLVGHDVPVWNLYGPTETTVWSSLKQLKSSGAVTIGKPIANTQVYVVDEEMEPVPVGVSGELYIGGVGVARGYLNRPELTAERFVPDPFVSKNTVGGGRLYRTGDLVRWQVDGNLEYLGRLDQQVKIRGFRIELEEIEAVLERHPGVARCVVLAREDQPGEKRLVAYVVKKAGAPWPNASGLEEYLKVSLPEYMVPTVFVELEKLPLNHNGKLDPKALPAPEQDAYAMRGYEAPRGEIETKLAEVWVGVLQLEKVGRHDNFFELGGHSLLATRVISRIREVFHVEVPLRSLFQNPTVAGLALQVDTAARTAAPPLLPLPREQSPRLSFAQERLWFLSRYEAESSWYNVPVALRLRGPLNREALHAGLQEIVARHEVLRTSFPETDGIARQNIASAADLSMPVFEMVESEMPKFLRQQARLPFDLDTGPLIRTCLLQLGNQDYVLLVVLKNIVCDGWSLGIMLRELTELYSAFSRGAASPLQPLAIQYADFSEWQREWLQGELLEKQTAYWETQLAGVEPLDLPTDRTYSTNPDLSGAIEIALLPQTLSGQLKTLSRQKDVTLFMTLLTAFKVLLHRYSGQTDIAVGTGVAGRRTPEVEPLIGFFVNTLVLRTQFTEDSSVAGLLQQVRDVSLQAYAHQDVPFERLVEALDPVRELGRTPLFQALFALQNAPLPTVSWDGLEATASLVETGTAKFDLTLSVREEDGELALSLEYRTELFNAERMKRLLQHYRTLLEGIVVSVDARIGELELLSEAERQQLLVEWNRTEAPYSTDKCVHQLFEEQAAKTPQAVAVMDEDGQISYGEFNRRANQLAHYLARMSVGPEVRVGICMERDLEMMVSVLGVLKAGGAYVRVDPADPSTRRNYMVKDAGAKFVLTNERLIQQMAGCTEHVVDLKEVREEIEKQSSDNLNVLVDPENLAWVIYTSSSAGRPKGTAIPHRSAVSMLQRTLIDGTDRNPSVERWLNLNAPIEDMTYATYAEVKPGEQGAVMIRRALSNTQAYVLDGHMRLVPVGIKGELYLGGAGQARGYLNQPELTAEKYVPNPFSKTGGERLYRTAGLVRYQENGNLEFLGRLDSQVKIQGHRIEPGEIEAALLDCPGVTQAAVVAQEDKAGDVRLAGYVAGSERLDIDSLRSHLQQCVPEYMVPAALLQLDTLPLTANGKVDRKALLELESKQAMEEAGSLTLTPTEELIAGVWSGLLGKSEIRRDDNFFDLGGHSLTSIQMLARLEQVFHREIELRAVFEFPVLKDFSAYVDRLTGPAQLATLRPIVPTSRDKDLPLSFAQQRLWFLGQMEEGSAAYHIPFGLHLKGELDRTALGRALDRIVVRHEVLRTTFAFLDGEPVQQIGAVEASSFRLLEHDLLGHHNAEAE